MADLPPKKNAAFTFAVSLVDRDNPHAFKSNPTLASGDVKVDIDGAGFTNLATLPAVTPSSTKRVEVDMAQAEMNGDVITVLFSDAAGDEWNDLTVVIHTAAVQMGDVPTAAEISTDFLGTSVTELSSPPDMGSATVEDVLVWLGMLAANRRTQTTNSETVYKSDGTTSAATSTKTDASGTFTRGEYS